MRAVQQETEGGCSVIWSDEYTINMCASRSSSCADVSIAPSVTLCQAITAK